MDEVTRAIEDEGTASPKTEEDKRAVSDVVRKRSVKHLRKPKGSRD